MSSSEDQWKYDDHYLINCANLGDTPTQLKSVISKWRKVGSQQDAGEFLFYFLQNVHEEAKWVRVGGSLDADDEDSWAEIGKRGKEVNDRGAARTEQLFL